MTSTTAKKDRKIKNKIIVTIIWLVIWAMLAQMINQTIYLPSPRETLVALESLIITQTFWMSVGATLSRVVIGFVSATIIGVVLGLLCGHYNLMFELFNPFMSTIKTVPVMSFILLAIIWLNSTIVPIVIGLLMALPIIWSSTYNAYMQVDRSLIQMSEVYRVNKLTQIRKLYFPFMLPFVTQSMATALSLCWKSTVAAEVLSHPKLSLGTDLSMSKTYLETPDLFAFTLTIVVLSLLMEKILVGALRKKWHAYYIER